VPVYVDTDAPITHALFGAFPWQAPAVMAAIGPSAIDDRLSRLHIAYECPIQHFPGLSLNKRSKERLHFARFLEHSLLMDSGNAYESWSEGSNPPDFVVSSNGKQLGGEMTQLPIRTRREANGLFGNLRKALLATDRNRFAHLRDMQVYVWFGITTGKLQRPHQANATKAVQEMVEGLATLAVDHDRLRVEDEVGVPESHPDLGTVITSFDCRFYAVPIIGPSPGSSFFANMDFEVGLAFTSSHDALSEWAEIARLVRQHDNRGCNHLIISVGAPDGSGISYPAEETLPQLLLDRVVPLDCPKHISRVFLHQWRTGGIWSLYPDITIARRGAEIGLNVIPFIDDASKPSPREVDDKRLLFLSVTYSNNQA